MPNRAGVVYRRGLSLWIVLVAAWVVPDRGLRTLAGEGLTLQTVTPPPAITPEEAPAEFSLRRAARYLDRAALSWQKEKDCGTCHTNFAYLMARPALSSVEPPRREVREFFEKMVEVRWKERGPRWDAEVVAAATTLAWNDRSTTGKLHAVTRKALDRMCGLQRDDGGWDWLKCGWPPMESDDHYGVTFAALGIALAPERYAETPAAREALAGIRRYLKSTPSPSHHHRAMVLWASLHVDDLLSDAERQETLRQLLSLQNADGGWTLARLLDGWTDHSRKDRKPQDLKSSDGYATGLIVYVARQAGVPPDDSRLRRAVEWLKSNQRASGRWFTRSPTKDARHYITNAGTAYAVLALAACGEVPK